MGDSVRFQLRKNSNHAENSPHFLSPYTSTSSIYTCLIYSILNRVLQEISCLIINLLSVTLIEKDPFVVSSTLTHPSHVGEFAAKTLLTYSRRISDTRQIMLHEIAVVFPRHDRYDVGTKPATSYDV